MTTTEEVVVGGEGGRGSGLSLADRLKARREELGISQAQAARELDVARTAYRLWELAAARPAPDRWNLVARWLGISTTALLMAEGLISGEEARLSDEAADRFRAATGERSDDAMQRGSGDFFRQAQAYVDRSLDQGIVTQAEATQFREMFQRIRNGLLGERPR